MEFLWEGLLSITWQQAVMYVVGAVLIYLAIEKDQSVCAVAGRKAPFS